MSAAKKPHLSANGKRLGRPPNPAPAPAAPTDADLKAITRAAKILNRYDSAGRGRRMAGWNPPKSGPNVALVGLETLRSRAYDSARNDWASESGAQKWATALIGIGITPRFKRITNLNRRKEITDLFVAHSRMIDADCVLDFFGQQTLVVRSWFVGGEVFARRRSRFLDEGLPLPFQVQLLEADMCPLLDTDSFEGLPLTNKIRSGIEINKRGKRVAYWFYKEHPNDASSGIINTDSSAYIRVAASEVTHVFEQKRPGQMRGVSELAVILARLRETGDYEDAVLTRQKIANLFVAFIKRTLPSMDPNDPVFGALTGAAAQFAQPATPVGDDAAAGQPLLPMSPGLMQELEDGQSVEFANPPEAGTNYSDYLRTQTLGTSAALGLPYELHSGDIREVSDRTLRVIINEFRRLAQQRQWQMVIPMFCQRVIDWFADAAFITGAITQEELPLIKLCEHSPHGWEYIHPVQDPQGKKIEVDAGFRSRSSVIGERGDDADQVDLERQSDLEREKTLGIWVDPNPPPIAPAADPAADDEEDNPDDEEQQNAELLREVGALSKTVARMDGLMSAPVAATPAPAPSVMNITINPSDPTPVTVNNQVDVPTPNVTVHNKVDVPTPNVSVHNQVDVPTPSVTVHNEVQPAEVTVSLPDRKTESSFKRDADGNIVKATQIETTIEPKKED